MARKYSSEWLVEDRSESAVWKLSQGSYHWVNRYINPGHKVLDYGCGSGYGTSQLSGQAVGVDVSEEYLAYARKQHPEIPFHKSDGILPFADDSFDVVTSIQVIEHVEPVGYLLEAERVLKPNGLMLVITPPREIRLFPWQRPWNPFHITEYSKERLTAAMDDHFEHVEYLPMAATGELGRTESARWQKNKILSIPLTMPIMPDSWRRRSIGVLSGRVSTGGFTGDPEGEVSVGATAPENGLLMNHCVVARFPKKARGRPS
jgi:ubiquinone/menaquinone biosynthesis C-methylase UbiE